MPPRETRTTTAIDAAHRSSIYRSLVPILGEEDANVLLSQFPATDADELVTKDFPRAELAELRAELCTAIGSLRSELGAEIGLVRTELHGLEARVEAALARQTRWVTGAIAASLGISTGVS